MKSCVITGVTGQDGAWLSNYLLSLDYKVFGMCRRSGTDKFWRLRHLNILDHPNFTLVSGDMTDQGSLNNVIQACMPDECYNLAAQSFVHESFNSPVSTDDINSGGVIRLLESIKRFSPSTRFYQAGSSEQFGYENWDKGPMNEDTPFWPRSQYGASKACAHYNTRIYREAYGMFTSVGLLFNHESTLRGEEFVTTKICKAAAEIAAGQRDKLELGNLEASRDWGHSPDYVRAMHAMLQQDEPGDFVIATGEAHSIRDLCNIAFTFYGLSYEDYVVTSDANKRPADVGYLLGDATKAEVKLGWERFTSFEEMIINMCRFWSERCEAAK
jgi:GDPmannose 4,6-dehydratase